MSCKEHRFYFDWFILIRISLLFLAEKISSNSHYPGHRLQLLEGDSQIFPSQLWDIISGSAPGSLSSGTWLIKGASAQGASLLGSQNISTGSSQSVIEEAFLWGSPRILSRYVYYVAVKLTYDVWGFCKIGYRRS